MPSFKFISVLFSNKNQKMSKSTSESITFKCNPDCGYELKHISIVKINKNLTKPTSLFLAVSLKFQDETANRNFIVYFDFDNYSYKIYSFDLSELATVFDDETIAYFAKIDFTENSYFENFDYSNDVYCRLLSNHSVFFQKFALENQLTFELVKHLNRKVFYSLFFNPVFQLKNEHHVPLKHLNYILSNVKTETFEENFINSAYGEYATKFNNEFMLQMINCIFKYNFDLYVVKSIATFILIYLANMICEFISMKIQFFNIDEQLQVIFKDNRFPKELLSNETFVDFILNNEDNEEIFEEYKDIFNVDLKDKIANLFPLYVLEAIDYKKH